MSNFWRKLHFYTTVVAGLFIAITTLTGCVLASEPWFLSQYAVSGKINPQQSLSQFQNKLQDHFIELFSIEIDAYHNIKVEGIGLEKEGTLFVRAQSGEVIEGPKNISKIFDFSRDLHRSFFLKTLGRVVVGLAALALVFLCISGIGLHIKRAGGIKSILKPITLLEIKRDGHALWSRWFLVFIFIIAISGVYLSVARFSPTPKNTEISKNSPPISWNTILMKDVRKVSYPMTQEEALVVECSDKILYFDAFKKTLIKLEQKPLNQQLKRISFWLHTGEGSLVWSGVLFMTSLAMLFLNFTGFQMMIQKWRLKKHPSKQIEGVEIVILVGSETGNTWRFADVLQNAFHKIGLKVAVMGIDELPQLYQPKKLVFLCSTYADGDAPENAKKIFKSLEEGLLNESDIEFSVLGFGSSQYPAFCAFAHQLRNQLANLQNAQEIIPYATVDNQSVVQFMDWVKLLNKTLHLNLRIELGLLQPTGKKKLEKFQILEKKTQGDTVLLRIAHSQKLKIQSGDLIAIYPPNENLERYYSIASMEKNQMILLIKKTGVCSNYLANLEPYHPLEGYIKPNPHFHQPKKTTQEFILIANGTGIAPFLGMQSPNTCLFWGGKTIADLELFRHFIHEDGFHAVFSQGKEKSYVQDLIALHQNLLAEMIANGATIMICGSKAMLEGVLEQFTQLAVQHQLPSVQELKDRGRILIDCY